MEVVFFHEITMAQLKWRARARVCVCVCAEGGVTAIIVGERGSTYALTHSHTLVLLHWRDRVVMF
jgi:hypothetical protein